MHNKFTNIVALIIFLLASFFRFYGVNWDQGQHLHPDERFLTMVANGIAWPKDLGQYLDTTNSPLNPHNRGYGFFVYGTFPVFFTKWIAESFNLGDYGNLTLVGRRLSALFDLGTVVLVYLIAREITAASGKRQAESKTGEAKFLYTSRFTLHALPLLSMFFYATMVLPIQLSHFYAVETYLTFYITFSFYLLIIIIKSPVKIPNTKYLILNTLLGISFGLAIASKITALLFLPIIGLGMLFKLIKCRRTFFILNSCFFIFISSYLTLRLAQPYLFANQSILDISLNQKVINNWKELKSFDDPHGGFPPAVQWITTKPLIFPFKNILFWGLGLPLGTIAVSGIIYYVLSILYQMIKRKKYLILNTYHILLLLSLFWILLLFLYQGIQFSKTMRYFHPIYPFLAILSAFFATQCLKNLEQKLRLKIRLLGYWTIGLLTIIYPIAFISIYSHPHTRVQASEWIYQNIPEGSYKSDEHWDDALPLSLPTPGYIHEKYQGLEFPLYWPDNKEKWEKLSQNLAKVDYIILTSNRLYGSIMTYPKKYPLSIKYYNSLFDGSLGFEKIAEFTSRPNIPIPGIKICLTPSFVRYGIVALKSQECNQEGISFVDDYADETFTVYDHPKVVIFKKTQPMNYFNFLYKSE